MTEHTPEHKKLMARIDSYNADIDRAVLNYRIAVDAHKPAEALKARIECLQEERQTLIDKLAALMKQ